MQFDESYLRHKISLENALTMRDDCTYKAEIHTQMMMIEERLIAKIKQANYHSMQEIDALQHILLNIAVVKTSSPGWAITACP